MSELIQAFALGNAAILTNACLLPLYPGLIAFLANNANNERAARVNGWLGVLVLAGILTMMLLIGFVLYTLQQSFGAVLSVILPAIYLVVIVFGVLLLLDRSPFAKLATAQAPIMRNPLVTAYVYGLLFGPMTLPCTGPIITSAFLLGANDSGALMDGLLYFLFFGLGFGWPLVVLPLIALPVQRRMVSWLGAHHTLLNRASGVLLIAVGVFGFSTELLPQMVTSIEITPTAWGVYWLAVALLIGALIVASLRAERRAV